MMWLMFGFLVGCESGRKDAPSSPEAPAVAPQSVSSPASKPSVPVLSKADRPPANQAGTCPDGKAQQSATVTMGTHQLVTNSCTMDGQPKMVSAHATGTNWTWTPGADETSHQFEWIGNGSGGQGYMVLRFWACPMDGCERATFFRWDSDGALAKISKNTLAHRWFINAEGQLEYEYKEGFVAGYSIASAIQTQVWDGAAFKIGRSPFAAIEFNAWPCGDTEVEAVNPSTGQPTGASISIKQGDQIDVLNVGRSQPLGVLFEYRVNGKTFWASNWQQSCAG